MNIFDTVKKIFSTAGRSESESSPETSNTPKAPDGNIVWKDKGKTRGDSEKARAAYLKVTADGYARSDSFNADSAFNDAFLMLDSFDRKQKKTFMRICRELADSCYDEKNFYEKNQRGCFYGYVADHFDKPDLSLLKEISPEDYPYLLAVGAICKNGYFREEAFERAAEYPGLLSLIIGGFNDRVREVRTAAEKSFDIAFDSLARIIDEDPESCDIYPIYKMHPSDKPVRPRYKALAILFRTRARAAAVSRGGRFDSEKLAAAENRLDSIILKNLDEETVKYLESCYIKLVIGWFDPYDRLHVYRELFKKRLISWECAKIIIDNDSYITYMGAYFLASVYTEPPEEGLRELVACSDPRARCNAARRLFEKYGLWEGSEALLTDPAASVRETAVFYYEKLSDMDLHDFYLCRLPDISAIISIALCSCTDEQRRASAEAVRPLINSENTRTAAAAIRSLSALDPNGEELYGLIKDIRPRVSKAALKAFLNTGDTVDCKRIYGDILSAPTPIAARRLTSALLRQKVTTVKILPFALRLCVSENHDVSETARCWVQRAVRNGSCWYGIGDSDGEEILKACEEAREKGFWQYNDQIEFISRKSIFKIVYKDLPTKRQDSNKN
ncbi:MAG: hypothetical protein K2K57_08590 [Oscillospiraceae bacterium]|nr:hypothetical protein [Oscillospiraceae bacterium]